MSSSERIAIVTGASRGIGAAITERLGQDGFAVVVNYASRREEAEQVLARLHQQGRRAIAVQADVASSADVRRLFDEAERQLGPVDVLVNNAGIMKNASIAESSDELYEQHFAINTKGTFNALREAAARLNRGGRVINFSSTTVALNLPNYGVYIATKAAVESFTRVFAKELRGRDICVNAVAPGPVETALFLEGKTPQQVEQMAAMAPLGRLGQPEDIAGLVAFLAGPEGGWINGQIIRANGGLA